LHPNTPAGITTVLVVVLFLGAIQLLGISIVGEYIGKIFEEVKQRPKFIVKSIIKQKK
jgi:polyisoprenyl-phosphate glycosyltransferase